MKKLLFVIILGLVWGQNVRSQEFYPNKELDIDKFINFDLNNYKFEDYEKIIGSDLVESWNGDSNQKTSREWDWKKINIKIDGSNHELRVSKLSGDKIALQITIKDRNCRKSKSLIPKSYIKNENYLEYYSDLTILKMQKFLFSVDTKNQSRLKFNCMMPVNENNEPLDMNNPFTIIRLSSIDEGNNNKIVPLKLISCELQKGKTTNMTDYQSMPEKLFMNFYISDGERLLLNNKKVIEGNLERTFNIDLIHTEETRKYDANKPNRNVFYEEYKIDRINGKFNHTRKIYDKTFLDVPNNIETIDYIGICKKKDIEERAF